MYLEKKKVSRKMTVIFLRTESHTDEGIDLYSVALEAKTKAKV